MTSYDYSRLSLLREYFIFMKKINRAMVRITYLVIALIFFILCFMGWYLTVGMDIYSRM